MAAHQLRCLQHLFDKGYRVHPGTLISAVRLGDLGFVRFLHSRGVPLWEWVLEEGTEEGWPGLKWCICDLYREARSGWLTIPQQPQSAMHMRQTLMYGAIHGAPVTPAAAEVLRAQRRATQAVLHSFHAAARLGKGEGSPEQRAAWAVMGCVPFQLVENILVFADLEITESLHRSLLLPEEGK
jgi:hypothetical protein